MTQQALRLKSPTKSGDLVPMTPVTPAAREEPAFPEITTVVEEDALRRPTTLEGLDRRIAELEDADNFDWSDNNPRVVIPEQPRTAVYWNPRGQLVIRQERGPLEEDDNFVFFNPDSLKALIAELQGHDTDSRF